VALVKSFLFILADFFNDQFGNLRCVSKLMI
jgi:hypothetical protein